MNSQKINKQNCMIQMLRTTPQLAGCPWYKDVIYFLQELRPPDGMQRNKERDLKLKEIKYFLVDKKLYWKDPLGVLLRCLDPHKAQRIMSDFHDNLCGGHHFWRKPPYKILRVGYFWPTCSLMFVQKSDPVLNVRNSQESSS
jgi:hypothetical protein